MNLKNKTVLITGAASGIGKAIALKLGSQGANVVVNYRNEETETEALGVCDKIVASGGNALTIKADISIMTELTSLFEQTKQKFGSLDILINNAAVSVMKPVADVTENEYDFIFNTNVKAVFFGCQLAAKMMSNNGRIVNLSSATTGLMLPNYGVYDSTKGAIEQLTRILSKELGAKNITVNTISPGATDTEFFRKGKSEEFIKRLENMSAFNRLGTVEDIADSVAFIVSEEARWITGQNIRVSGGTC
jgi:3-oxoacyl-[acyl-carrier protein] reductase